MSEEIEKLKRHIATIELELDDLWRMHGGFRPPIRQDSGGDKVGVFRLESGRRVYDRGN
jgi:hypothetical protein